MGAAEKWAQRRQHERLENEFLRGNISFTVRTHGPGGTEREIKLFHVLKNREREGKTRRDTLMLGQRADYFSPSRSRTRFSSRSLVATGSLLTDDV